MSHVHHDGFDLYGLLSNLSLAQSYAAVSAAAYSTTEGRYGGGTVKLSSNLHMLEVAMPSGQTTVIVGVAIYLEGSLPVARSPLIEVLRTPTATHVQLEIRPDGTLAIYRGNTELGASTQTLAPDTWYHLGFAATIANGAGIAEIEINGQSWVSLSGIDTQRGGVPEIVAVEVKGLGTPTVRVDDLYVFDGGGSVNNALLGDAKVLTSVPDGDTAQLDWTPSTGGDNYALVDEGSSGPDTSDYVSGQLGDRDLYTLQDTGLASATIAAVQVAAVIQKTDAGARSAAPVVKSSAVVDVASDIVLSGSFEMHRRAWELDPNGDIAWTAAAVDALEAGMEVTV